jgi:hypothetical protein
VVVVPRTSPKQAAPQVRRGARPATEVARAIAELLATEAGIVAQSWTTEPARYVEPWWFVASLPGYKAMALRDSPVELKRHGVFVNAGAFDRV